MYQSQMTFYLLNMYPTTVICTGEVTKSKQSDDGWWAETRDWDKNIILAKIQFAVTWW